MNNETTFRILFVLTTIFMLGIRVYFQRQVLPERKSTTVQGNPIGLIPGAIAALTAIVFGLEYIFGPGTFRFAYVLTYPAWLRWFGALLLGAGLILLGVSHAHLGRSFYSLVAMKENQLLVDTGPYRYVRHPIYTAYFMNYLGGGFLAANIILTAVPVVFFGLMITFRIGEEEAMMVEEFGDQYRSYMKRTGRFLPFL